MRKVKHLTAASIVLALFSLGIQALAADEPVKAPPAAPPLACRASGVVVGLITMRVAWIELEAKQGFEIRGGTPEQLRESLTRDIAIGHTVSAPGTCLCSVLMGVCLTCYVDVRPMRR
jgi:hypothetical protein